MNFSFDDGTHGTYDVDWPDGIKPVLNSKINLKFEGVDYNTEGGAGGSFRGGFGGSPVSGGLVYISIGFESIYPEETRNNLMGRIMNYLEDPLASADENPSIIPDKPQITALYPNPSNKSITIEFKITKVKTIAYLTITDILGREIHKMSVQSLSAKKQRFNWNGNLQNGSEAPSGIYIANLSQDEHIVTKKFTLLK